MTYPSIAAIQAAVCAHFRVTHLDLLSRRRGRAISRPRQVGMWLARHTTPLSLPEI
ncbi:MAG TPA: helix-turn-helix domain-containing protein, partial [Acetobacteraceae bacterium]|nr:helix-turn-helix domain-containing protein [Acetobacteraceae bacterium]